MCVGLFLSLWSRLLPQERNCLFAMVGTSQFCTQLSFIVLFNVVVAGLIDSCETLVCLSTHGRSQVCRSTVSWLRGLTFAGVGLTLMPHTGKSTVLLYQRIRYRVRSLCSVVELTQFITFAREHLFYIGPVVRGTFV